MTDDANVMRNEWAWSLALAVLTVACAGGVPGSSLTMTFDPTMDTTVGDSSTGDLVDSTITLSSGVDGPTSDAEVSTNGDDDFTSGPEESTSSGEASTSGTPAVCGDDMVEGDEACDGTDLLGEDCESQGFDAGTLGCKSDCTDYDTGTCMTFTCGNGVIEGMETCDGVQLGGESCVSQGFNGGALSCAGNCMAYNTSQCTTVVCGNGLLEAGEVCDGGALGGQTCVSQGFDGGVLGCEGTCADYDTGACTNTCIEEDIGGATGLGVTSGSTAGEDDTLPNGCVGGGADHVISFTAPIAGDYTFDTFGSGYDTALALATSCAAGAEVACNDDSGGTLQSQITYNLAAGQNVLVVVDGYNAATGNWVLNITAPAPPLPACAEQDLGFAVGSPVASGTTVGADEDLPQSCAAGGAVDHVLRFIAPAPATFQFDTVGSGYDTALSLHDSCAGPELVCNDDSGGGLQSQLSLGMVAGQQVLVAVSGYAGSTGNWTLNITQL
jgi:hypothetical protein